MFSAAKSVLGVSSSLLLKNLATQIRSASYLGLLRSADGAVKAYKRLGRGPASKGQKSGRGQKGQKARGKVPHWLEGGQTPYYKLFPITGFKRPHKRIYNELNLIRIQEFWDQGRIPLERGQTLNIRVMKMCGLITGKLRDGVKLLGTGKDRYNVPLNVEASKASETAIESVRSTGHEYTSIYHTKLGLQAHVDPDRFLLRKGYVPLQARPLHQRDISYYSDPAKGGYLLKDRSLLLDFVGNLSAKKTKPKKSALEELLETASTKSYLDYSQNDIIDLSSFKA